MKQTLIDADTGKQLPSKENSGKPTSTTPKPTAAAARPAAVGPDTEEPGTLLPVKRNGGLECLPGKQQLSCQKIETLIKKKLACEKKHTRESAAEALQAGVLFHIYQQSLGIKRNDFWEKCEQKFKITRGTISKKMRLAVIWAKKHGASEQVVMQLAEATNLGDKKNPAVQLAFDFIGDKTITDLYRENHLIPPAPLAIGGDTTKRDKDGNVIKPTQEELLEERAKALEILVTSFVTKVDGWTDPRLLRTTAVQRDSMLQSILALKDRINAITK